MEENRLPKNKKEGFLYGGIIALITVIIMVFLNITTSFGKIDKEVLKIIGISLPIFWIIAMIIETTIVGRIAEKLVDKFTKHTDGFNTKILFNILFCVTGMSFLMTIIGGMYGEILSGNIGIDPILDIPSHWPRNFFVAFWCEILVAQPVARFVMKKIHNTKNESEKNAENIKGKITLKV